MYHGDKSWLAPAVEAECDHGHDPSELSSLMLLLEVDRGTGMYLK
jgi:hypothetical protein